jgi:hypothetical protein
VSVVQNTPYISIIGTPAEGIVGGSWTFQQVLSVRSTYSWKAPYPEATFQIPRCPPIAYAVAWAPSTAFVGGKTVRPSARNGHLYECIVGGTTAAGAPTWPTTPGTTVIDGSVTWREAGADVVYDDQITIRLGAGTHNALRFVGLVRRIDYQLWPRGVGILCNGYLVRASEYTNSEDSDVVPGGAGGLLLYDLTGTFTPTDEQVVKAVLTKARVPYTSTDIGGASVVWGGNSARPQTFLWRAGTLPFTSHSRVDGRGESAAEYINRWDAVSAVYTDDLSPAGFYRTFETVTGVKRQLIGARPRADADLTFTEGLDADIVEGSGSRQYPLANRVFVSGYDAGLSTGAVSNIDSATLQSSNPFMPGTERHDYASAPSSPFLERGLDSDPGDGMSCEKVANAVMLDVNRETVSARFTTGRDDLIWPGYTVQVQAGGGIPDRLGIGEKLWVDEVTCSVTEQGVFQLEVTGTGGGLPDPTARTQWD